MDFQLMVIGWPIDDQGWTNKSATIAKHLRRKCDKSHQHGQLIGGKRCTRAAIYTDLFSSAIIEGYKLHMEKILKKRRSKASHQCSGTARTGVGASKDSGITTAGVRRSRSS